MIRRENVLKKLTPLFALILTFPLAGAVFAQDAPGKSKSKETRWEGKVEVISKDKSSLRVRQSGSTMEKTCAYDSSTKWVSQYHRDKNVNNIDSGDVKEGDYVICKGTEENAGVVHATLISKRLSHSQ
jgi:hypothetical protein